MSTTTSTNQSHNVSNASNELMGGLWNLADALEPWMGVHRGHASNMFPHGEVNAAKTQSEALVAVLMGLSSFCNSEAMLSFNNKKGLVINGFEMDVLANIRDAITVIEAIGNA
jgi:hypothetical protein